MKTTSVKAEEKVGKNNWPKIKNMPKTKALFLWKKLFGKTQNIWFILENISIERVAVFETSTFIFLEFYNRSVPISLKIKWNFCFTVYVCFSWGGAVAWGWQGVVMPQMILKETHMIAFFTFHISIPWLFNLVPEVLTAGNTLNCNPPSPSYWYFLTEV